MTNHFKNALFNINNPEVSPRFWETVFWGVSLVYCLCWFVLPLVTMNNLRPDSLEITFMGKEWILSSNKHPAMAPWLIEIALMLTGRAAWAPYLVSQIAVLTVLWCIWTLSKEYLPRHLAFLVVVVSMNYRYLNIGSLMFHPSIAILPFWALSVVSVYYAFKTNRLLYWVLTGLFIACGMQCKYPMALLAMTLLLFVFVFREARRYRTGAAITVAVAFFVFLPQLLWLVQHDFSTLKYATQLAENQKSWVSHLFAPLVSALNQAALLIAVVIPLIPLASWRWRVHEEHWKDPSLLKMRFLFFIVVVPVGIQLLLSAIGGANLRAGLGTHLWLFFPLLLVYGIRMNFDPTRLKTAFTLSVSVSLVTMVIFMGTYQLRFLFNETPNNTDMPGRQLAVQVEKIWHDRHSTGAQPTPLLYVAGGWELGANVAFYGKDRPTVLQTHDRWGLDNTPPLPMTWASDDDLNTHGGIVLWRIFADNELVPSLLNDRFPEAEILEKSLSIPFQYRRECPPLRVGIAIIPPSDLSAH